MSRILMVTNLFHPLAGGSERVVFETSRRLVRRGHDVHVLTERTESGWPAYERVEGIHIHRCAVRFGNPLIRMTTGIVNAARLFQTLTSSYGFDMLHFHLTLPSVGVLLCRESRRVARVATFHGPWDEEVRVEERIPHGVHPKNMKTVTLRALQRYVLRHSQRIVVLSRYSQGQVFRLIRNKVEPTLIPGGVDIERFYPAPNRCGIKSDLGLPTDGPVLLSVRRLVPRMGIDALIDAMAVIQSRGRRITLVIGGDGPMRAALERQAATSGLKDRIRFTGYLEPERLVAYYQAADLFVLPTRALEGFGLSTVEALACGTPVLGTAVGATAEILQPLDPRLLIPETTAGTIAQTALACLDSPVMQPAFRTRCRRHVETRYTWDRSVDALETVYDELRMKDGGANKRKRM